MQFSKLVGGTISLSAPRLQKGQLQEVKLLGVEAGGLWIESQSLTNATLQTMGVSAAAKTPVFFLPFHEISLATTSIDQAALDEKALGL